MKTKEENLQENNDRYRIFKKYYNRDINNAIKRLEMGEPVQYIVGNVDFWI